MNERIEANVHREGSWWVAEIPSLGQVTQARTISSVEEAVREVASLVKGGPAELFQVDMDIQVKDVPEFATRAAAIRQAREQAQELERQAQEETRVLAKELKDAGVSVRDTAEFLGVSHQRIHQLTQ